ncbi:MAG: hypothetical protein ACREJO_14840 [Phycisphaerales bacterium]
MTRLLVSAAGLAASVFALAAAPALALPPIMDRVPTDASVTVVVPNMEALAKSISNLATLVGAPMDIKPDMLLQQAGVPMGLVKDGAVAAIIPEMPEKDGDEPKAIVLVPTTDYKAFIKNLGGEAGDGIAKLTLDGKDMFSKSLEGNYAALSNDKATLEKFTGKTGNAAAHKTFFGSTGDKLSDKSEASVFVNFAKLRPKIKEGMKKQAEEMAQMTPDGEGPLGEGGKWLADQFANDTSAVVLGVKFESLGVSLDAAPKFTEGSKLESISKLAGKSTALLNKLPAKPYLAAFAIDTSNPAFKAFLKDIPKPKAGKQAAESKQFMDEIESSTGRSVIIAGSKGGVATGLLGQMLVYTQAADPTKAMNVFKTGATDPTIGGGEWKPGVTTVDSVSVNEWSKKVGTEGAEEGMGPDELYGNAEGPIGYAALTEGGFITTYSKSSELISAALKAVKGEGSLAGDKVLQQVAEKLPNNRMAEVYIGLDTILNSVPQAQMVVGMMGITVPASMPPIALSISPDAGSAQASIFLPTPVLKMIGDVAKNMQGQGAPDGGGRPPKNEKDDKGDKF